MPVSEYCDAHLQDVLSTSVVSLAGYSTQPGLMALAPNSEVHPGLQPDWQYGDRCRQLYRDRRDHRRTTTSLPLSPCPALPKASPSVRSLPSLMLPCPLPRSRTRLRVRCEVLNLQNGGTTASIPVPGAHFVVCSPDGNHVLVFSDNSDAVTVISTVLIGTLRIPGVTPPVSTVQCGVFSPVTPPPTS